jgi:hypothetical protein
MWRKHLVRISLPVIILAGALAGGVFAYKRGLTSKESAALNSAATPAAPIVAGVVAQHDVPIYLTGVGTVIAFNTDIVRPPERCPGDLRSWAPLPKPAQRHPPPPVPSAMAPTRKSRRLVLLSSHDIGQLLRQNKLFHFQAAVQDEVAETTWSDYRRPFCSEIRRCSAVVTSSRLCRLI